MTQREFFNAIIALIEAEPEVREEVIANSGETLVNMAYERIVQLEKKNSYGKRKPSKTVAENEIVRGQIILAVTKPMRVTEVAETVGITHNRATALLTQLVKSGLIKREVIKKIPYFCPAEIEVIEG